MVQRKTPLFERDISWLSFNHRVLQEVKDLSVPLLDRLKFMAIYSSNLEEFFKVRVAQLRNLIRAGRSTRKQLDFEPELLLKSILKLVNSHQKELSNVFNKQLLPDLRAHGIHILGPDMLSQAQLNFVDNYFHEYLQSYIQPILLVDSKVKPFLHSGALYLYLHLFDKKKIRPLTNMPSSVYPRINWPDLLFYPNQKKASII